jgi:hypothetical protein
MRFAYDTGASGGFNFGANMGNNPITPMGNSMARFSLSGLLEGTVKALKRETPKERAIRELGADVYEHLPLKEKAEAINHRSVKAESFLNKHGTLLTVAGSVATTALATVANNTVNAVQHITESQRNTQLQARKIWVDAEKTNAETLLLGIDRGLGCEWISKEVHMGAKVGNLPLFTNWLAEAMNSGYDVVGEQKMVRLTNVLTDDNHCGAMSSRATDSEKVLLERARKAAAEAAAAKKK